MKIIPPRLTLLLCLSFPLPLSQGAEVRWTGSKDSLFVDPANWDGGVTPDNASEGDVAVFDEEGSHEVLISSPRAIMGLAFQAGDWTLRASRGQSQLTLGKSGINAPAAGTTVTLDCPVRLHGHQKWLLRDAVINASMSVEGSALMINGNGEVRFQGTVNVPILSMIGSSALLEADIHSPETNITMASGKLTVNAEQLTVGKLTLKGTNTIVFGDTVKRCTFADSSTANWSPDAKLVLENFDPHKIELIFGTDGKGLSPDQLKGITTDAGKLRLDEQGRIVPE